MKLKKLHEQVVVITGATSGIGLVTARMAAKRGAKLVLVARTEAALCALAEELQTAGAEAIYVKADVGVEKELIQSYIDGRYYAPNLTDKYMDRTMFDVDERERHSLAQHKALHNASGELRETGDYDGHVAKTSFYTKARLHPRITAGSFAFLATALGYALLRRANTGAAGSNGGGSTQSKEL